MKAQPRLRLISHHLCPYVQRAAIVLAEKGIAFEREYIDLAHKPDWFLKISPFGKVPVLLVDDRPVFESAVICEYLDEVFAPRLHPGDALTRAQHRSWMEFGSGILHLIWGFYTAPDRNALELKRHELIKSFARLEQALGEGPYFGGAKFTLVDAVFAPVFRYFDVFEAFHDFGFFDECPRLSEWRAVLAKRPFVIGAVTPDYAPRLVDFLLDRPSELSRLMHPEVLKAG